MNDREKLRVLAEETAKIAQLDVQKENAELYRALNRKKPIRPVVLMDEIPWNQLSSMDELKLTCEGEFERNVEWKLRKTLYAWNHFRCDMIVPNEYRHPRNINIGSNGMTVKEETISVDEGNNIISHAYKDQLFDDSGIAKMHMPEITVDEQADETDRAKLEELFGDILPIRLMGLGYVGYFEPWDFIARYRGVEALLYDLADRPEHTHKIMERMTAIGMGVLEYAEKHNLIAPQTEILHCTAGLADELSDKEPITRKDMWGRGAAQIFASVSSAMHDEYEIKYAKQFFEGFGLLYYGCCEPLHNKIDILRKFPNLRKISITPWANADIAADNIGSDYVMAHKPNPSLVATDNLNEDALRKELGQVLAACKRNNTPVEFTLKDISSVKYHPENLDKWAKIALSVILS